MTNDESFPSSLRRRVLYLTGMLSEKPWKDDSVLWLVMGLLASIATGSTLVLLLFPKAASGQAQVPPLGAIIIGTLSFHGVALALIWRLLRQHQVGWRAAFGFGSPGLTRTVGLGLAGAAFSSPVAMWLGN